MASDLELSGYVLGKQLHKGTWGDVYLGVRTADDLPVVLKVYHASDGRGAAARREFEATKAVAHASVPQALALDLTHETPVVVLERVTGIPLASWVRESVPSVTAFLRVACQIAEALSAVHQARLLHRDVTPTNVLVDPATLQTHLIDFGLARPLGAAAASGGPTGNSCLEGTLCYIAPEQTGRMNRGSDYRSDLYTLGATLYFALTGRPPFEAQDPLELIHAHIARTPVPPSRLRPEIPKPVSEIVLKLLRKEPDERYQRAAGLLADLRSCLEQLEQSGQIEEPFELGTGEAPDRPLFPRRVFGRDRELEQLQGAYAAAAQGQHQLVLISGPAGSGKSVLVDALRSRLSESPAYVVEGRFDVYRERPYGGWIVALESLIQQLLVASDTHLEKWGSELREGMGKIARALVDLVPDLAFILGEVPPVPQLGPRETQQRLALALERFMRICATPEHPLVLFLDNLQWSDADSRFLLDALIHAENPGALLIVTAYRNDEAGDSVEKLIQGYTQRGGAPLCISLGPLASNASIELLSEALLQPQDAVRPLAEQIERKTGNSPLLIQQFVEHLHDRGLFRYRDGAWHWDADEIAAASIPDGAVALMTAKIERLPSNARSVLEFASCVGSEFSAETLTQLGCDAHGELDSALYALADAGLIAPCRAGFRFVHDRLRESAQALLSDEARSKLHYDTGQLLLSQTPDPAGAALFDIVEHLNRGARFVQDELRLRLIALDVKAARQALAAGAAAQANRYATAGASLFAASDWDSQRNLGFELHLLHAETAFQSGMLEQSMTCLAMLDGRGPSQLEKAQIAAKRIQVLALQQHPIEVVRYTLSVLRELGVRWPLHPSTLRVRLAMWHLRWQLSRRADSEIFKRAASVSPQRLAIMTVTHVSGAMRSRVDGYLVALSVAMIIRQSLRHGFLGPPSFLFAAYALFGYSSIWDAKEATRFARLAMEWLEREPDPVYGPRTESALYVNVNAWLMRRRRALAPVDALTERMREAGDPEWANYTGFQGAVYRALAGDPVPQVAARLRAMAESVERSGHLYPEPSRGRIVYDLLERDSITDEELERTTRESDEWLERNGGTAGQFVRTMWLMVLCIYGRHDLALQQSEQVWDNCLFRITPAVHIADHTFYRGIAVASLAASSKGAKRRRHRRDLRRCIQLLSRWSRGGPDFAHMVSFLRAEEARLRDDWSRADTLYLQTARAARSQEFVHNAALAHERRAALLFEKRRDTAGLAALEDAIVLYAEWGARAKVAALEALRQQHAR